MSDGQLSLIIRARDEASAVVDRTAASLDKLGVSGTKTGSVLSGIGAGIGVVGVMGVAAAASKLVDVLGDATRAAMEDEASVSRLTQTLRENAPAWNGSMAAVERFTRSGQDLAFTDDAIRDSIGKLVVSTGDVSRAMDLSRTAMDLARLRGLDLSTATDMVNKAVGGQIGALRRVLPFIDANATATEALAAIQTAARGQAEAYAETTQGSLLRAQIQMSEAMEALGRSTMPAMSTATRAAADEFRWLGRSIDDVNTALSTLGGLLPKSSGGFDSLGFAIGSIPVLGAWIEMNKLRDAQEQAADKAVEHADAINSAKDSMILATPASDGYAGAIGRMGSALDNAAASQRFLNENVYAGMVALQGQEVVRHNATERGEDPAEVTRRVRAALDEAVAQRAVAQAQKDEAAAATAAAAAAAAGSAAASAAMDRQRTAASRLIDDLRRLDDAQQTVYTRLIRNMTRLLDAQLAAIDAARAQRDADRQSAADKRDLATALGELADAQASGDADRIASARRGVSDVQDRIAEAALRAQEDKARQSLAATKAYIDQLAQLESSVTNRKAWANTLAARETALMGQREAAVAGGDASLIGQIDAKLAAIRATETRNEQAMRIGQATAAVQVYTTVHTTINVDGAKLAAIVDRYLARPH